MPELAALIFDFDGTIAETERDGHRVAYNAAFADARAGWRWDVPTYGTLLAVAGGKERLAQFIARERPDLAHDERATLVALLHESKRRHFDRLADDLPLRPGIMRLVAEARAARVRCAIATTASPSGVAALLRRDSTFARAFDVIVAGDAVPQKKPAPDIYALALERLGIAADAALAFEDSAVGLRAARAAGLVTTVTPSMYTGDERFDGAAAVIAHLGEPGDAAEVSSGPPPARGYVDLTYARELLRTAATSAPPNRLPTG